MKERYALPLLPRCFDLYSNFGLLPGASKLSREIRLKLLLANLLESHNTSLEVEEFSDQHPLKRYFIGKYIDPVSLVQFWLDSKIDYIGEYSVSEFSKISKEVERDLLELMGHKEWLLINDVIELSNAIENYKVILKTMWPPLEKNEEELLNAEIGNGWFPERIISKYFPNYLVKYTNRTYRVFLDENKFNGIEKLENNLRILAGIKVKPVKSRKRKGPIFPWADITQVTPKRFRQVIDILIQWLEMKDKYIPFDYWTRALRAESILATIESGEILTEPGVPPYEDEELYLKCGGICTWGTGGIFGDPDVKKTEAPYIDKSIIESIYFYPISLPYLNYVSTVDPKEKFAKMLQLTEKLTALAALLACSLVNHKCFNEISKLVNKNTFTSTGIGTWLRILRNFDEIKHRLEPYDSSFSEFLRPSSFERISKIGKLRNNIAHPITVIHTEEAQNYINDFDHHVKTLVYNFAKFIREWDLVIPESTLLEGKHFLRLRKLAGPQPYNFSSDLRPEPTAADFQLVNKPCIKHYFTNELIPLTPFITWQECPSCKEYELFYLNQYNNKFKKATYVSFVTQHKKESVSLGGLTP